MLSTVGLPGLLLIGVVALLFFGPKRLPEMARGLGEGMKEFKDSVGGHSDHAAFPPAVAHEIAVSPTDDAEAKS